MKSTKHISELIKSNKNKMDYLYKNHKDEYFLMLGNLIVCGYQIQDAIDECYKYFTENR
jgi:hypothetical protein